jgi:hypothetical protein
MVSVHKAALNIYHAQTCSISETEAMFRISALPYIIGEFFNNIHHFMFTYLKKYDI